MQEKGDGPPTPWLSRLERIKRLEVRLAAGPATGRKRRVLRAAIRITADTYRPMLDSAQTVAQQDTAGWRDEH
jgi:hypothetical protein